MRRDKREQSLVGHTPEQRGKRSKRNGNTHTERTAASIKTVAEDEKRTPGRNPTAE